MTHLIDHFRQMARNNAWANERLLSACCALDEAAFAAPRVSYFPSLRETLVHNLIVDRYYLDALEEAGRGEAALAEPHDQTAPAIRTAQAAQDARLVAFTERLTEADLSREVATDRGERGRYGERIADILAHLFQHQIHHRGQAHAMLAGTEVAPPQLDEFFLRFDRDPAAARVG